MASGDVALACGVVLSSLLLSLLAAPASAASFDPKLRWQTIRTEHAEITFHDGEEKLAEEAADAIEGAWRKLVPELDTAPRERVRVLLTDWTDGANGSAQIAPHDQIVIYVTAPGGDTTLGLYEDWNEAILTHELTHIFHLDTVHGLPLLARWLMGSIISTHQVSPGWITEGFATFQETRQTHGGRGRSAMVDMVKRAAVLEDRFPPLGNLEGYQSLPPSGNLRYLFGQDFMQFIADKTGDQKWTDWVRRYGASIPYILPAKQTFGESFVKLYFEWKAALEDRYGRQKAAVEAQGITPYTRISPPGQSCGSPGYKPDGSALVYSCYDYKRGANLYIAGPDGDAPKILKKGRSADNFAWRPDGKAFVYTNLHTVDLYYARTDLYLYDVEKKTSKQLTSGARAEFPSFSPDGSKLIAVTNDRQQNQLAVLKIDQTLEELTHDSAHEQYGWPRYSPDGQTLAVSVWKDGMRDLWLYTAEGKPLRRLTADIAIDREPTWSADGRWLYFTSDRSGIANIYAIDFYTDRIHQVTNVVTGASNASLRRDGKKLAFNIFETNGSQVMVMDVDPARFRDLGQLPVLPEPAIAATERPAPTPPRYEAKPYNPLPTLFPPTWWLPGALLTTTGEGYGLYLDAYTGGSDTLHQLSWSGYLTWRTDANFIGGGGSFTVNKWRPVFGVGFATYVTPYSAYYVYQPAPDGGGGYIPSVQTSLTRYWDHRTRGSVSFYYPLDEYSGISAFVKGESRQPLDPLPDDVYLGSLPTRGWFTTAGIGWSRSKGEAYPLSISTEDGRVLAAGIEYTAGWAGSYTLDENGEAVPFDQVQATAEWREYTRNPWIANHVLATRVSAGATLGSAFNYGSFRLGGYWSEGGITVVPDEWRALRGFYPATVSGEWFALGSAEYRFPLWNIDRGVGTFPVFVKGLSGAIFVDAGNAFDAPDSFAIDSSLVGTGAELRLSTVVGYGLGLYGRFGYAFAAHGDGIPFGDPYGFYATIGSSF